jgi:NAD(P)-dependent dehydrogenase (short-subunit alcohol dehydrogenase family)
MNVIITGASRGIGLKLTKLALEHGDQVLAVARKPAESPGLAELLKKHAKNLEVLAADLTDPETPQKISATVTAWPQVDVLINNAGVYRKGETLDDFLNSFHVNSVAPFLLCKALLPKLRKAGAAKVAHVTSLMGSIADNSSGGSYAYRSSKTALNMINKCLAVENEWLTTIVVHPGWVKTDMGGSGAPVEPEESASGIWKVVHGLKKSDTGSFFDFRGKSLPW